LEGEKFDESIIHKCIVLLYCPHKAFNAISIMLREELATGTVQDKYIIEYGNGYIVGITKVWTQKPALLFLLTMM